MNLFKERGFVLLLGALLVMSLSFLPSTVWADQAGAANAISNCRIQLVNCYNVAIKAEAAGANITTLTVTLNEAGWFLSQAEFAFSNGNFGGAQDYAVQSQGKLADFVSEANVLLVVATARRNHDFLLTVVGSTGGTFAVLAGSFGLWSFLKKKHKNDGEREIESTAL
jgi:hypothetical protein